MLPALSAVAAPASTPPAAAIARVVIAEAPASVVAFKPIPEKVRVVVNRGIQVITGKTNTADAWRSLVSTQDVVGLKITAGPGPNSGTRPAVISAVIEGLLAAGLSPTNIVVWDRVWTDLQAPAYRELAAQYRIRLAASSAAGYDERAFYETPVLGNLLAGDLEFGRKKENVGRRSYLSRLVTQQLTKIITISPLLNHNVAGVNGALYSLALGSIDNALRFDSPGRLMTALPEIYALPQLGDRVALNIVDALVCQYEGEQRSLLHYAAPLNQIWFSKDPVALDILALEELDRQRQSAGVDKVKVNLGIYENAALLELGTAEKKNIRIEYLR